VKGTAKKALLGSVAAAVMVLGLPMTSASADAGDSVHGGCSFNTDSQQQVTQGQNNGAIEVTALMLTSANTPDAGASVDCKIQVNGVDAPGTEIDVAANAAGLVQGQAQISFDDQNGTLPSALCEKDNWGDGDTSGWVCQGSTEIQIPPQQVIDLLNTLFITVIDPTICPVLIQLHNAGVGIPGVLSIGPDGDVTVADPLGLGLNPVEDCPPYLTTA
jgi:hypothetical protein